MPWKNIPPPTLTTNSQQQRAPLSFDTLRLDDLFCIAAFAGMVLSIALPPFRYLNYVLPMFAIITILANQQAHFSVFARPYLLIVGAAIIFSPLASTEGAKDIYLILTGLSASLVGFRHLWSWRTVFIACLIGSVTLIFATIATKGFGAISQFNFNFATSESTFESSFSYVFGLLAVWAAHTRQWKYFLWAFLFAILTLKRIAVVAVVLCVLVQTLPRGFYTKLLSPAPMILANALFLALVLSYGSGKFDLLIYELTGQSANQFGLGRQALYGDIVRDLMKDPLRFAVTGAGAGDAYSVVSEALRMADKANLHSDTLKILYEYGAIVLLIFLTLLYHTKHPGLLLIALYTNILLLTDNTLIYPFYIYFATLVAAHLGGDVEPSPTS